MQELMNLNPEQVPAWLREAFETSAVNNLAAAPSIDRISIRGRVWRLLHGGQEVGVNTSQYLDVIIIRAAGAISRSFYEGEFDDAKREAPVCWSNDGVQPDASSAKRQSNACATCPQNQAGSGKRSESKACRHMQRIAVVLPGQLDHVYAMTMPATSLWGDKVNPGTPAPLTQYASFIASKKLPIEAVITRMQFDINETAPTIRFQAVGFLSQADFATVNKTALTDDAKDAVTFNPIVREVAALAPPMPVQPIVPPQPVAAPQPAATLQPVTQPAVAPAQTGFIFPGGTPPAQGQAAQGFQPAMQPAQTAPQPSLFAASDAQFQQPAAGFQSTGTAEPAKRGRGGNRRAATPTVEAQAVPEPIVVRPDAAPVNAATNQEIASLLAQWGNTDDAAAQ